MSVISLDFTFHWLSHIKSILVHLCEYKFTLKLCLNPSPLVTSLLLLLVLSDAVAYLAFFCCSFKKPVLCKQSIYLVQCIFASNWGCIYRQYSTMWFPFFSQKSSSQSFLREGSRAWGCVAFSIQSSCAEEQLLRGHLRKLHPTASCWEIGFHWY